MHREEELALAAERGQKGTGEGAKKERIGVCELLESRGAVGRCLDLHFPSVFSMTADEEAGVCEALTHLLLRESARLIGEVGAGARVLFVGLGNRAATADALGPLAAERIRPTAQLPRELREKLCVCALSVFCPQVAAQTGIESTLLVRAAVEAVRPSLVILADAMASAFPERLGRTAQISDVGLRPGGGVGEGGVLLGRDFLGVPVLSVGFPTVLDATGLAIEGTDACVFDYLLPREADAACLREATLLARAVERAFGIPAFF
jgi:GPR endopeptidase